jgi:hypothetical protein
MRERERQETDRHNRKVASDIDHAHPDVRCVSTLLRAATDSYSQASALQRGVLPLRKVA